MVKLLNIYQRFKPYFHNTSWIIGERFFTLALTFLVTILVARYLGPERYGVLAYALSLTSVFAIAGHMGLVGLVVRELVKQPENRGETLGTTFALKLWGFSMGYILLFAYVLLFESPGTVEFFLILILGLSLFFKSFTVIDAWFKSRVQAKYIAIAGSSAAVLAGLLKVSLVFGEASLIMIGVAYLLQSAFLMCGLLMLYRLTADVPLSSWKFQFNQAKMLVVRGAPVFLASVFATIYLKVDKIMLRWLVDASEVGIYTVAATLSEVWYFLPTAIVASLFPRLIHLKESNPKRYRLRLQQLFDLLFMLALAVAVALTFLAEPIISSFFGSQYAKSSGILSIHIWAGIFIFMRAALSKWILIEDALVFSLITQGSGALFNVALNFLLIPAFGGTGAAWATLIAYAVASYGSLLLYKRTRIIFGMMSKAMLAPIRLPAQLLVR